MKGMRFCWKKAGKHGGEKANCGQACALGLDCPHQLFVDRNEALPVTIHWWGNHLPRTSFRDKNAFLPLCNTFR
jgi:hypothetical protein